MPRRTRGPTCRTSCASGWTNTTWTVSGSIGWAGWSGIPGSRSGKGLIPYYGIAPIARAARETAPTCYLIGEYWPIPGRILPRRRPGLVPRNRHRRGVERRVPSYAGELPDADVAVGAPETCRFALGGFRAQGFTRADQVVNYVVSHDERRPEHEIQFWGEHIQLGRPGGAAPVRHHVGSWPCRRRGWGLVALLTSPGVPMLLAGQEFGEDSARTIEFWPLDWKKLDLPQGRRQFAVLPPAAPRCAGAPGAALRWRRVLRR